MWQLLATNSRVADAHVLVVRLLILIVFLRLNLLYFRILLVSLMDNLTNTVIKVISKKVHSMSSDEIELRSQRKKVGSHGEAT